MDSSHAALIKDFPPGPLDFYRKQATFDWKKLKLVFEDPQRIKTKDYVWSILEKDDAFKPYDVEPSPEEQKRIAALQLLSFRKYNFLPDNIQSIPVKQWLKHFMTVGQALVVVSPDAAIKLIVDLILAQMSIILLGNSRQKMIGEVTWNSMKPAAFMLTEIAHGSDIKNMKTTATYNEETQDFILHTPDFQAAKCWSGNLGLSCTIGVVFAQLYIKKVCYGLHAFLVPIRHPDTHELYPGLTIKDGGLKLGLNGVDNGVILFHNYRIPRSNLLNKFADVTANGEYVTKLTSPGKVFGSTIGNLSTGRVSVVQEGSEYLIYAVIIAIRYAAVRKQFGVNKNEELALIEHQLHESFRTEMHVILSAAKPLTTWSCQEAIQECREACGGHGFLKASGFGYLRNTNDARVTYEGDNNVLLQQTSRWLLKQWDNLKHGIPVDSPLKTCNFLNDHSAILKKKCTATTLDDYVVLSRYWSVIHENCIDISVKNILITIGLLYGLSCLEKHLVYIYEGNFNAQSSLSKLVRDAILSLCSIFKCDAVAVVDALSFPDFVMNSVLGKSNGKVSRCFEMITDNNFVCRFTKIYKMNFLKNRKPMYLRLLNQNYKILPI
ncbi:hypothetical protein RI129_005985 [Pyrocoelia pectoralis]|uniref:Acyl-coenzyme A oxidase n=1 Tax=Pyrocoelia pectoralis TaxID=417401 RepID=A0AAN7VAE5_9COLE